MSRIDAVLRAVQRELWAIVPEKLDAICEVLRLRAEHGRFTVEELHARLGDPEPRAVVTNTRDGVAVIPVVGIIAQRRPLMGDLSDGGGASTERIGGLLDQALAAEDVRGIVLDVDSPGGTVQGVAELHAKIRAARGRKPIVAVANSNANSAAYWIAAAADELVATPSALVGSIGVYTVHVDESRALEQAGLAIHVYRAGKFKAEGVDGGPLSDEAEAAIQDTVDAIYGLFVRDVAQARGVTPAQVREGYGLGRAVVAQQALADGMVDRIGTLDETIARLANPRRAASIGRRADVAARRLALDTIADAR